MNKIFETNHIIYRGEPITDMRDGTIVGRLLALAASQLSNKTLYELINQRDNWYLRLINPNGATKGYMLEENQAVVLFVEVDICDVCHDLTKVTKLGEIDGQKACATCLHNERQGVKEYD